MRDVSMLYFVYEYIDGAEGNAELVRYRSGDC